MAAAFTLNDSLKRIHAADAELALAALKLMRRIDGYANQHHNHLNERPVPFFCGPDDAGPRKPTIHHEPTIMKMKNILIISLAVNVVLLSALAYIQSLEINPDKVPPIIYLINHADPDSISAAVAAAALTGIE